MSISSDAYRPLRPKCPVVRSPSFGFLSLGDLFFHSPQRHSWVVRTAFFSDLGVINSICPYLEVDFLFSGVDFLFPGVKSIFSKSTQYERYALPAKENKSSWPIGGSSGPIEGVSWPLTLSVLGGQEYQNFIISRLRHFGCSGKHESRDIELLYRLINSDWLKYLPFLRYISAKYLTRKFSWPPGLSKVDPPRYPPYPRQTYTQSDLQSPYNTNNWKLGQYWTF